MPLSHDVPADLENHETRLQTLEQSQADVLTRLGAVEGTLSSLLQSLPGQATPSNPVDVSPRVDAIEALLRDRFPNDFHAGTEAPSSPAVGATMPGNVAPAASPGK